jgi:hypothetical protein
MDALNKGAAAINGGIRYMKDNAWQIAALLILWYYVRPKGRLWLLIFQEAKLLSDRPQQATLKNTAPNYF